MAWLEDADLARGMQLPPGERPIGADIVVRAWNMMDGIDWNALPVVVELFGITDIERFIVQLKAIRDHHNAAAHRAAGAKS